MKFDSLKRACGKACLGLAIAGMAIAVASCGGKDGSVKEESVAFERFSFKGYACDNDTDSLRAVDPDYSGLWEVTSDGVLPVAAGKHDVKALRDTLMALAGVRAIEGKIAARFPSYVTELTERPDTTKIRSLSMNKVSVNLLNSEVLVMQVFNYAYPEGAAHGIYANTYVNYDLRTGKVLGLSDIFQPDFEKYILPQIIAQLKADGNLTEDEQSVSVPQNFRLTEEGVEFVFGIYAVAPYSNGEPRVGFYTSDLEDILTPEGKALLAD